MKIPVVDCSTSNFGELCSSISNRFLPANFSASRANKTLLEHTCGCIVGDTTAIDLVRDPASEKFRLAVLSPGRHVVVDRCNVGRRVFLPARIPAAFARQIRWPDRCGDLLSTAKLASELRRQRSLLATPDAQPVG
jgi:hypothetical protein